MPPSGSTPDQDPTQRLAPGGPRRTAPFDRVGPAPEDDHESATFLDPTVWGSAPARPTPVQPPTAPPEDDHESATFLDPTVWDSAPARPTPVQPPTAPPEDDHESATFLDPTVWDSAPPPVPPTPPTAPTASTPSPEPELRRFGPGVPPQAAVVWRGEASAGRPVPPTRRRRAFGWLVWAAVLLVLLAVLLTRCRADPPLDLTGVSVTATPAAGPTCGGTAVLTASVTTNGNPGTIRYRWLRSDGTSSGELVQPVQSGDRRVDLVLRWTFDGPGTLRATATVEVLAPQRLSGSTTFDYTCAG
ncbi:hypothetical protein ACIRD3_13595 [Kitasatospora sp. NPDC093550]|uniref:hypothetical protein n=1 Tax=Kitasatospora sp. NPDC093550 TaxID=3364089 RepID=UPI003804F5E0